MRRSLILAAVCVTAMALLGATRGTYNGGSYAVRGGYPGAVATGWDTLTYIFTFDPDTLTNVHTEFTSAIRNADSIIDLSDPANGFAFCMIDSAAPNSPLSTVDANAWLRTSITSSAATTDRWKIDSTGRRIEMFRIPFEDFIPLNSQIVWARVKKTASSNAFVGVSDTLCSTLMTNSSDSAWYASVGTTAPSVGQTRYAHATWRYQVSGLNIEGYPAANGGAWVPELQDRDRFWDYGSYSDWSGRPSGSTTVQFTEYDQDITNCAQAAVRGVINNGIATTYSDVNSAVDSWYAYSWEATGAGIPYRPWVEVKFLTRKYRAPWPGGSDFAFSIQCDDGRKKINDALIADLSARSGGKYTTFVTRDITQSPDGTYIPWADLLAACSTGVVEVGSHSFYSWSAAEGSGVNHYAAKGAIAADGAISEWTLGMYPDTLTAAATVADTLYYDVDPGWMTYEAELAGYGSLVGSNNFAQSFGVPVANHNPWAQKAFFDVGYKAVRILSSATVKYDADGNRDFYTLAAYRPADSDTVYQGLRPDNMGAPRNVRMIASSVSIQDIVGAVADNPSQAEVTYATKNAIENQRARGTRYVGFLVHDVKTDGDGPGAYDTSSADADELGWIFDVVDTYGSPYMTITEIGNRLAGLSEAIATPASYAQPDSFKFTAGDGVWGTLDGIDDTFIPGVK